MALGTLSAIRTARWSRHQDLRRPLAYETLLLVKYARECGLGGHGRHVQDVVAGQVVVLAEGECRKLQVATVPFCELDVHLLRRAETMQEMSAHFRMKDVTNDCISHQDLPHPNSHTTREATC